MDSIMEYSLNTPTINDNILNSKIINMIRRENQLVGGAVDNFMNTSNCIVLIVGIIVVMVGFYLCWNKNDFITTNGQVQNLSCDTSNFNSQCKFNVTYSVDSTQYSKVIQLDKSAAPTSNTITVYYRESDPNVMRLYNFNYSVIGIILVIIGAFVLISSICCTNNMNFIQESQPMESNIYMESKNSNGIVYTKM